MAKGKGKKRGLDSRRVSQGSEGNVTDKDAFIKETSQPHPREAQTKQSYGGVAGWQRSAGADSRGHGTKGAAGGARSAGHAPPWWCGSRPCATTWIPTTVASPRVMGLLGHGTGDPLKCMSNLIGSRSNRTERGAGFETKDGDVSAQRGCPVLAKTGLTGEPKRGSFEAIMDILQGVEKLRQAREGFLGKILEGSSEDQA